MPAGEFATIRIVVTPTVAGTIVNAVSVAGGEPDPTPGNNSAAEATSVDASTTPPPPPQPSPSPRPGPEDDDDDKPHRERRVEEPAQLRERTNRLGLDAYRTEGNVAATDCEADPPTVTIGTRDGDQVVRLLRGAAALCRAIRVGDHLEAGGEGEHELAFVADEVTIHRAGERVR